MSGIHWEAAKDNTQSTLDWLLGTPLQIAGIVIGRDGHPLARRTARSPVWSSRAADAAKRAEDAAAAQELACAGRRGRCVRVRAPRPACRDGRVGAAQHRDRRHLRRRRFVMVLDEVGIPIGPLLASAGIAGVALGFGAQSLVQGLPVRHLHDPRGPVRRRRHGRHRHRRSAPSRRSALRVTRLRDGSGVVWYVRNGEILRVGNHSQGWSTAIVDVSVAYNEDIPRVQRIIREIAEAMADEDDWVEKIIDDPTVAGVESVTGNSVTIRVVVKCKVNEHFGVQRELRVRIKAAFDRENIQVPAAGLPGRTCGCHLSRPASSLNRLRAKGAARGVAADADAKSLVAWGRLGVLDRGRARAMAGWC